MAVHLTREQLDELRTMLVEERARLHARRGRTPDDESVGEVRDGPERAATDQRWDIELSLGAHDRERLREVDAAIERIDKGRYGICEETGDPIPFARLHSQPTTRYTVEALELIEQDRARERVVEIDDTNVGY